VRDEDVRRACLARRRQEAWREGEHAREQVAIGKPEREGVGGPVRVAPYADVRRIDRAAGEGVA
jgi:hypothetical protein